MARNLAMKRMTRERETLEEPNEDFKVCFKDDNLLKFDAYVIGNENTPYSHKFIKLRIEIPDQYPLAPPKCTFIQHSGPRIHPNLYQEGKVCLSILGTWEGPGWTYAMKVETVLRSIRSLLDDKPYTHEPGSSDCPEYTAFVEYTSWQCLLLDYLQREQDSDLKLFLQTYVAKHGDEMLAELKRQAVTNAWCSSLRSVYSGTVILKYDTLETEVEKCVMECKLAVEAAEKKGKGEENA